MFVWCFVRPVRYRSTCGGLCETKVALTTRAEMFNLVGRSLSFRHAKLSDDESTVIIRLINCEKAGIGR